MSKTSHGPDNEGKPTHDKVLEERVRQLRAARRPTREAYLKRKRIKPTAPTK